MKKKIKKEMNVEVYLCNICGEEITSNPFNKKRIEVIRFLFNTQDFHAHEGCINSVIKKAFYPYMAEQISKGANKA